MKNKRQNQICIFLTTPSGHNQETGALWLLVPANPSLHLRTTINRNQALITHGDGGNNKMNTCNKPLGLVLQNEPDIIFSITVKKQKLKH